jgi:acetylglutamate kinase
MKEMLHILKIGGNVLSNDLVLASVLSAFSKKEGRKIIVHGGGKKATVLAEKLGIPSIFVEGRRITDTDSLEIAVMTYAGWYNKKIVAHCHSIGLSTLGLSGADANAILSVKRPVKEVDFGWVGDPVMVNVQTQNICIGERGKRTLKMPKDMVHGLINGIGWLRKLVLKLLESI